FLLSGDAAKDEAAARAFVDVAAPEQSALVTKSSGQMHGGGAVLPAGDARLATILAWARGLAPPAAPAPATEGGPAAAVPAAPPPAAPVPPPFAPPGHGAHGGL